MTSTAATPSSPSPIERFCFPIPARYSDEQAAPLLCAGLIGYRALRLVGEAERIGFYGFGSAAHILCQVAVHQGRRVFAFTREGDTETQTFARRLGAEWAGSSEEPPPEQLDGAIVFAPVGALMPAALRRQRQGSAGDQRRHPHERDPRLSLRHPLGRAELGSVANLTRADGEEFLELAPRVPIRTEVEVYPLSAAQQALSRHPQRRPAGSRGARCQRSARRLAEEVLLVRAAQGDRSGPVLGADEAAEAAQRAPRGCRWPCRGSDRRRPRPDRRRRSGSPPARRRRHRGARASRRAGANPAQPIATSAWPTRQARPKLSEMIDRDQDARRRAISARIARAEASGSSGNRQTVSGSGRLEPSMPALAQTKPWWVSTISTPRSARSTSALSSRISSTSAGSLPSTAARRRASPPGRTEERRRTGPPPWRRSFVRRREVSVAELGARRDQLAERLPSSSTSTAGHSDRAPMTARRGRDSSPLGAHIPNALAVRPARPGAASSSRVRATMSAGVSRSSAE